MNIQSSRTWCSNHSSFMENTITCHLVFKDKIRWSQHLCREQQGPFSISCLIQTVPILEMPRMPWWNFFFQVDLLHAFKENGSQHQWLSSVQIHNGRCTHHSRIRSGHDCSQCGASHHGDQKILEGSSQRFEILFIHTVNGRNLAPVEVGSLSQYLRGFIDNRWCRISSINSST